jgi:hypothetical protein
MLLLLLPRAGRSQKEKEKEKEKEQEQEQEQEQERWLCRQLHAVACKDRNAQWQSMFDACGGDAA